LRMNRLQFIKINFLEIFEDQKGAFLFSNSSKKIILMN
jgi:hypothetical protein